MGPSQSIPFHAQHSFWHTVSCLPPSNRCGTPPNPPPFNLPCFAGTLPYVQPLWSLGSSLVHHQECFVLLPNRCRISQSILFRGLASSLSLVSFSNRCGTLLIHSLQGPASLLALIPFSNRCGTISIHPPQGPASSLALVPFSNQCETLSIHSLRDLVSLLAHRLVSTPL